MSNDQSQDARRVFMEVSDLSVAERTVAVIIACGGDAKLRARVEALLRAQDQAAEFMEAPTASLDHQGQPAFDTQGAWPEGTMTPRERAGQMIGRYKLLQTIGEGGFGSVWMAEQREPVKRRVALKIIKLGMDTKQVIARFEAERQALAMMDHPNIARVLDAGSTEAGRPYFVMEYIKGVPILEYCDTGKLDTSARLELFSGVCLAIQHAHQKGIIHRDIKPSNVLVTMHDGVPVPKVIDFGIAKATSSELTQRTLFTEHRQIIGTPAYMSPEQAEMSGLDIDTRSDIYSLGVLLYELLTGTTPFAHEELVRKGFAEMLRIIREVEPHKPSTRLSSLGGTGTRTAELRQVGDPGKLGLLLRGDLDWIVMKCLEKDRVRRYETASGLAADIKRHLRGEAVLAAPPDPWYRLRKTARRHRVALVTAGLVVAALVTGVGMMWYGLARATRDRDLAELARGEAVDSKRKVEEQSARAQRVSDLLISRFVRPAPFAQSADAVASLVQKEAEEIFGAGRPEVTAMLSGVGAMLSTDITREREALVLLRRAMEYQKKSVGANGESLVMPYVVMGSMTRWTDQPTTLKYCREVLRLSVDSQGEQSLAAASAREALALHLINSLSPDEYGEVLDLYTRTIPIYEKQLGDSHARTLDSKMACGQILGILNRFDEGGAMMGDAFEKSRAVPDTNPVIRLSTATNLLNLYKMRKDKPNQVAMIRDLVQLNVEVLGERSEARKRSLTRAIEALRNLDEPTEADRLEELKRQLDVVTLSPAAALHSAWFAFDTADFARALLKSADLLKNIPPSTSQTPPWDRYARFTVERLAIESLARTGPGEEAVRQARALLESTESREGPAHGCTALAHWTLAQVLRAATRHSEADAEVKAAIRIALGRKPRDYDAAAAMLESLRDSLKDRGNAAEAATVTTQLQSLDEERHQTPILGGFEGQDVGAPPAAWMLRRDFVNCGVVCVVSDSNAMTGQRCLRVGGFEGVDKELAASRGLRNPMQSFDARPYRGKKVRLSAAIRLDGAEKGIPEARLWMRADRPNFASPNMFDNMGDHPVAVGDWKVFSLTGVVDADANEIYIGLMVFGEATAWLDDVSFEVVGEDGNKTP